ncbi:MAG: NTP transferase domain-containing protein, partial [Solirubrobacteraceae bacterium]
DVPLVVLAAGRATRYGGIQPLAPVGPSTEAILDVLAGDALAAGFGSIVLVVGTETGDALRAHVEEAWPRRAARTFCTQGDPRGTVDAVLAAKGAIGDGRSFGVANADDLPGRAALALLARHLVQPGTPSAVVCFALESSLLGDEPVTRGVCRVGEDELLRSLTERRQVHRDGSRGRIVAGDGLEPAVLDPGTPVSMNLFGFRPHMLDVLDGAMRAGAAGHEVLLPDVVDALCAGRLGSAPETRALCVLRARGRCIGVTHAADTTLVHDALADEVGRGERPVDVWADTPGKSPA